MPTAGKFTIDVYDCTVYITVCKDIKRSVNYRLRMNDEEPLEIGPNGFFFGPADDSSKYWIFFDYTWLDVNTVNHEKSHLVDEILKDRGIKPYCEVRAYLDGYVSRKFAEFFKKKKLKVKIK